MAVGRKASLAIGVGSLWLGGWLAWRATVNIVDITRWMDGVARIAADIVASLAVGALIGGLVMLGAVGASFIGHAAAPRIGGSVLVAGGMVAAVCGVLAVLLSLVAR